MAKETKATTRVKELRFTAGRRRLSALWADAAEARAVCVVAHGAGNDMRNRLLEGASQGLSSERMAVMRFNFPFTEDGRRGPDRPPVLLEAWRGALEEAGRRADGLPLVAAGKSLGGRMASLLAAEDPESFPCAAIVFFGYPLHAPGRTDQPRDSHLSSVRVPMLFIQGTADALADAKLIRAVVQRLGPRATLRAVEGADHSFRIRGTRRSDEEIGQELGRVAAEFIRGITG
jgi:predicted alpha/beta-hydrolase family hydrolase